MLLAGKIVGPFGVKGEAKILSYVELTDIYTPKKTIVLFGANDQRGDYTILSVRLHKGLVLLKLNGIDSADSVISWKNANVFVEKASLPPPEDGDYYWFQVIGLNAITLDGIKLGKVTDIVQTGSNDVYVVNNGHKEILLPAISSVVIRLDLENGTMLIDLPKGLMDETGA
ncbi:MAG: ribosome maturation factor RimM [Pseudomonadota bacterium]